MRVADREWDLGIIRSTAVLAGLLVALAAAADLAPPRLAPLGRRSRSPAVVCAMLLVPAVLLQVGLRDASEPWYFTNDSTYQIEIAGDLVLHGHDPYGHDYGNSGLERFYPAADDEEARVRPRCEAPLRLLPRHGADRRRVAASLPSPLDDYRIFVLLCTLALLPAALLFPGALHWRLAAGAALAANPLLVQRSLVRDRRRSRAARARARVRALRPRAASSGPRRASAPRSR